MIAVPPRVALDRCRKAAARFSLSTTNEQNRALAQATLEDEGYEVILAETGEEGSRAVQSQRPDCVLLDVCMPGTDGFTACSRIRALPEGSDMPVVFLTALHDVDTVERAVRVGADDLLTRPVRPTYIVAPTGLRSGRCQGHNAIRDDRRRPPSTLRREPRATQTHGQLRRPRQANSSDC